MSDVSPRPVDLELLSAYLDGELTEDERALVEAQLAVSEAWREELETLRWTVSLLHAMPEAPLPRSFEIPNSALEPAVASRPTTPTPPSGAKSVARPATLRPWYQNTRWVYMALRSATAISVALLLAVAGLDVWTNSPTLRANSSAQAPVAAERSSAPAAAPQAPVAAQAPAPAAPTTMPPSALSAAAPTTAPAAADAKRAEAPTTAPVAGQPPRQGPLAAPTVFPQQPRQQGGGGGEGGGAGAGGEGSTANGIPLDATSTQKEAPTTESGQPPADVIQAPAPTLPLQAPGGVTSEAYSTGQAPAPRPDPWRVLVYLFGGLALVFGVGAWLARRRLRTGD
jgi:anti-sigma factor RsiW